MITNSDIQRLNQRKDSGHDVLSLYLDMSVNSDNKRTHMVFLNKEKARISELESDRAAHHRLAVVFTRIENWIRDSFDPTNKGLVIFAVIGGEGFETIELPAPVRNRIDVARQPLIGPLAEVVHEHPVYGVITLDREHLRLLALHMNTIIEDHRVDPDAIDTAHDVHAGGEAHKDYQKRKAEETRHFFKDFANEIGDFDRKHRFDHLVLLGTTETTRNFEDHLPKGIVDRIIHTGHAAPGDSGAEIARKLAPIFENHAREHEAEAVTVVQDRVKHSHFATSGVHDTLVNLQEGKVERLLIARHLEKDGAQCTQCGFYLVRRDGACPYCGGSLRDGVDLVESMVRIAASQDIEVDYAAAENMRDLKGVAALLKF